MNRLDDIIHVQVKDKVRVDRYLTARLPHVSRNRIQRHIVAGNVLVDGRKVRANRMLHGGEIISLPPIAARRRELEASGPDLPDLEIVYEDADLLVVNKPSGLVVHPVGGEFRRTLLNALRHQLAARGEDASALGLVHRLDRLTSGLIVVAKRLEMRRALTSEVEMRRVRRRYVAVVAGEPTAIRGCIELYIRRDPARPTRMQALDPAVAQALLRAGGRPVVSRSGYSDPRLDVRPRAARTHYTVLRRMPGAALLRLELDTGRTHQIRVHLLGIGLPILGDPIYGALTGRHAHGRRSPRVAAVDAAPPANGVLAAARGLHRPALHASDLAFEHPRTGAVLRLRAPLPPDLHALLRNLAGPKPASSIPDAPARF